MPRRVKDLIEMQKLEVVHESASVRVAVKLMFENDYSQLPVRDDEEKLVGLFTEQNFTSILYFDAASGVLDTTVREWMLTMPPTTNPKMSIYDIMPVLAQHYAVVVVEHEKPKGIVTDYDIAAFLAEWSEGIALVEDIETRLRVYIEKVLPTENGRQAALYRAFNKNREAGDPHIRTYDKLSFSEHVQLITTEGKDEKDNNWKCFEPYFSPKSTFRHLLEPVDEIRNQIAHFRGTLTSAQLKTLRTAARWLESRPHVPETKPSSETSEDAQKE